MSLSRSERDLAAVAASTTQDGIFEALTRFADAQLSIGLPVRLIVSGHSISGVLAADEAFATELERVLDVVLREAQEASAEHAQVAEAFREHFAEERFFSGQVAERRAREDRLRSALREALGERTPSYLELIAELPDDVARDFIERRYHATITLRDAVIRAPDGGESFVPFIRVKTADISAWWLQRTESDGSE